MIFFNDSDDDVLGSMDYDGFRYQLRVGEGKEPDVYQWRVKGNARPGWVKVGGFNRTSLLIRIRNEWYRAGGTGKKATK